MKKYFLTSDVHGFYDALQNGLKEAGFDVENENHIFCLLGDAFDRGNQNIQVFEFLKKMKKLGRLIYIRGNHEYMFLEILKKWRPDECDIHNKTDETIVEFSEFDEERQKTATWAEYCQTRRVQEVAKFIRETCVNYVELGKYILVHGNIPRIEDPYTGRVAYNAFWRKAPDYMWDECIWANGMLENQVYGIREVGKTIVCGHVRASWGNIIQKKYLWKQMYPSHYADPEEFENPEYRGIYKAEDGSLIGLDALTYKTGKVNILVLDEENLK